jgi:hypothetical protein
MNEILRQATIDKCTGHHYDMSSLEILIENVSYFLISIKKTDL